MKETTSNKPGTKKVAAVETLKIDKASNTKTVEAKKE